MLFRATPASMPTMSWSRPDTKELGSPYQNKGLVDLEVPGTSLPNNSAVSMQLCHRKANNPADSCCRGGRGAAGTTAITGTVLLRLQVAATSVNIVKDAGLLNHRICKVKVDTGSWHIPQGACRNETCLGRAPQRLLVQSSLIHLWRKAAMMRENSSWWILYSLEDELSRLYLVDRGVTNDYHRATSFGDALISV
jgi:hypothetical protein